MAVRFLAWKTFPLWVGIVGALVALGSVLVSELRLQGDAATRPPRPSTVDGDLILTGFRISTLLDGQREWQLSALRARVFEQDHQALLDTVQGTVRTEDGSVVEFQGQSAVFDTVSHDLLLTGDDGGAIVRLPDGYVLRSDRLEWRSSQGEVVSDEAVSLSGPRVTIQGVGVRIRPATKELTILNRVRVDVL